MGTVTIAAICDGIAETIEGSTTIQAIQSYDELTEGLGRGDLPLAQVYWEDINWDAEFSTDRSSFGGGVRQKDITIHIDLYAATRSHLAENMRDTIECLDALIDILEAQNTPPFFTVDGIKSFRIDSITRTIFEYASGTTAMRYMGLRCVLGVFVY